MADDQAAARPFAWRRKPWPSPGASARLRHPSWARSLSPRVDAAGPSMTRPVVVPAPVKFAADPPPIILPSLSERLRLMVITHGALEAFGCVFLGGGKRFGVGIPSDLYCLTCGHARLYHDLAEAFAIVVAHETRHVAPAPQGASEL